jgi:hypothetical protein
VTSISFSAKRWAYSDRPSEASHCVIVATCYSLAVAPEHDTTAMQGNGNDAASVCRA